ncbi:MAG: HAMP domain-containing sensor histidine kinase [Pseudomonadota bacterium]|nr:HAMP domain-containing sensor histidine kinase [Pseudomonadota bacterium]
MPNEVDHTVNAQSLDRRTAINSRALKYGTLVATIAALAVMITGETLGIWIGAATLTLLIFLQIFWSRPQNKREQSLPGPVPERPPTPSLPAEFDHVPALFVSVSGFDRVRAIFGRTNIMPGLRVGGLFEPVLSDAIERGGVSAVTLPAGDDRLVIVRETAAGSNPSDDPVVERTQFFAELGHDLKSPLNGIIGFAEVMDTELRGPLPEAYQDYPALIRESGETLLRLVEDILGYAKAEAGTYELDIAVMDLAASGESVMRQSQAIADLSGVTLEFASPGETLALADAGAVRRIWDNLVSNAIKYSAKGDTVSLDAFERDGACFIQVRDTGAGMDAHDLARIAKPFAQGRNAKGRAGTGLGLAMVQRLAELQGGQVRIETAPGQGTSVTVKLPSAVVQKRAAE